MSTIVTRAGKGSTLTFAEVDANFTNLNTDKLEFSSEPVRHSVRPSLLLDFANTKQLDPRITFTRASTATFYDGRTTAKAEENLLLQSETFDSGSWGKSNSAVTVNATTAPDGTTTADKLTVNTTNGQHVISQGSTIAALAYTRSCYVKAGELNWVCLTDNAANAVFFNISTGVQGTVLGTCTNITITSVGSGWYRCSYTSTYGLAQASSAMGILASNADNVLSFAGANTTDGIFLWGAQLEQRSSVTAYTPTTTAAITNYIPALQTAASGVARFDHNPTTGESLGLLIEEQRVNIQTYSDQFNDSIWGKFRSSIVSNTIIAPDGTLTGDKLIEDTTATNDHRVQSFPTISNATAYTGSVYVKAGELTSVEVLLYRGATFGGATVNLTNGSVSAPLNGGVSSLASTTVVTSVGNGWYRISIPFTSDGTSGGLRISLVKSNAVLYTGDGFSGIYIWGAQLEAGAFATSYIPTVASQVTRSNDAASMTGTNFSSWYRADESTLYGEISPLSIRPTDFIYASINDTSNNNKIVFGHYQVQPYMQVVVNNVFQAGINSNYTSISVGSTVKAVATAKVNDFAISAQGTTAATDTLGTMPSSLSQMEIGKSTNSAYLNGTIKKIAYYPKRLTNQELIALSTV
jgi:hypothetical protein